MDALSNVNRETVATAQRAGDAVGVPKSGWFVAVIGNNQERLCASKLEKLGYECYVPTQTEMHQRSNGTRKMSERIIFPAMVFIHTTEAERKQRIVTLPFIKRFLTNRASAVDAYGRHAVAVIPDYQIQQLKYILGNADTLVEFSAVSFKLGDKVRVIRGGLIGAEGYVMECADKGSAYFAIRVNVLGVARVRVKKEDLELVKE